MGMEAFYPAYKKPTHKPEESLSHAIRQVERGYPFASFTKLAERLEIPRARLAELLSISSSTLQRRRDAHFSVAESGRIYQLETLLMLTERTVGDTEDARAWLTRANPNLGAVPLELARTAPGLEAVTRYLEQIADGVYL